MIITLKTIGAAFDYQDGLLSEADLKEAQKHNFISRLPSLLEYMGYSLNCGTHFAGPVYGIRSYLDWTRRNGVGSHGKVLVAFCLLGRPGCLPESTRVCVSRRRWRNMSLEDCSHLFLDVESDAAQYLITDTANQW